MKNKSRKTQIGKEEPEFKVDFWTFVFVFIGFLISWGNMMFILESPPEIEVYAFLSVILTTIVPGIIIALKHRFWGYGYLIGFSVAGVPFVFMDPFIGSYTFFSTIFIFVIMLLVFWRAWRTISSIKTE